jgi:hypothetical protein
MLRELMVLAALTALPLAQAVAQGASGPAPITSDGRTGGLTATTRDAAPGTTEAAVPPGAGSGTYGGAGAVSEGTGGAGMAGSGMGGVAGASKGALGGPGTVSGTR